MWLVFGPARGWAMPVDTGVFIFPLQSKHVHGSTIVTLPNGDLLAAWFYGSGERKADDACIMGARKKASSDRWGKPFLMADTRGIPDCNPVLFLNQRQELFLVWIAVQANKWEQSILRYRIADAWDSNGPPAWKWQDDLLFKPDTAFEREVSAKFAQLPSRKLGWSAYAPEYDDQINMAAADPAKRSMGWMTRIKPLLLGADSILLPLYSDGFNFSLIAISADGGTSWQPGLPIVGRGNVQPALIRKNNGELLAYMRDNGDAPGRVQVSTSKDGGYSWSAAQKSEMPCAASVEVLRMRHGRWLMLRNDLDEGRNRLGLFISLDEGRSWQLIEYLEDHPKKSGSFCYPAMIQSADGYVHITYSYQIKGQETIKYIIRSF